MDFNGLKGSGGPLMMTADEARQPAAQARYASRYFVVEKPGLDVALMAGRVEDPRIDADGFA